MLRELDIYLLVYPYDEEISNVKIQTLKQLKMIVQLSDYLDFLE